jgi:phosphoribosylglycinamide formyltransferase-1
LRLVVLISGSGSNLQALIDAQDDSFRVVGVISNLADAFGLERARRAGIPAETLSHREFADRAAFDQALADLIDRFEPGLVALAGFMRILTPAFVARFSGRMMNIHPSLLPRFRGLHTHQRVLEAGDPEHGASVHFVTVELDGGPLIIQSRVPVLPDDDPDRLAARVLTQEHRIYPAAVRLFAGGRLRLSPTGETLLDGRPLRAPLTIDAEDALPGAR